ncbi:MAG: hypothetical protein ACAI38_24000, partial [Myxococcota bacterium]
MLRLGFELGVGLLILWALELLLWRIAKTTSRACRARWPRWQSWGREHPLTAAFAERFPGLSRALWLR